MGGLSKEYANSSGTGMVIEIKLLERRDLKGRLKEVKISTVLVQCVKFLTFLVGFTLGGPGDFGV
jgi:hypothetical protein